MSENTVSVRPTGSIVGLDDGDVSADDVGTKAARLARLRTEGFLIPDAVVIPVEVVAGDDATVDAAVDAAIDRLGPGPFAVRSSAVDEDGANASFAGIYESVLDVSGPEAVARAVRQVIASAGDSRVRAYDRAADGRIAVMIQHLVRAEAAGVAFTANPVTGSKHEVHVTAVTGLGESLVSGAAPGEEWTVRADGEIIGTGAVLDRADVARIAELARAVERLEASPQDLEWAIADGELWLLQARPMTALPDEVSWAPPGLKGWWRRDFRIAEWLPEPVTPLFETWFLPTHEAAFARYCHEQLGMAGAPPFNVVVNGWCFSSTGRPSAKMVASVLSRPLFVLRSGVAASRMLADPRPLERVMARPSLDRFRSDVLPRYQQRVAAAEAEVDTAPTTRLVEIVDDVCESFGELMLPVVEALGFAYKSELALATFYRRHLADSLGGSHMTLLGGLGEPTPAPPHAVVSLDWVQPTLGERGAAGGAPTTERHEALVAERLEAEGRCRAVLADQPKRLRQFDQLLAVAHEYVPMRSEIAHAATLGWPVTRRAIGRLGEVAVQAGAVKEPGDVHFLTRSELEGLLTGEAVADLSDTVAARREVRRRQARLVPPTRIGPRKSIHERSEKRFRAMRCGEVEREAAGTIVGEPSSPGVATGPARIVTDVDQFDRVQPGDILVAQITAPGWTPLFSRIAGVVTDGGSAAAHASIVAREYGIPAVVGTRDATKRLRDGALVTVDGARGVVVDVAPADRS